jgi:hypothetical protein
LNVLVLEAGQGKTAGKPGEQHLIVYLKIKKQWPLKESQPAICYF